MNIHSRICWSLKGKAGFQILTLVLVLVSWARPHFCLLVHLQKIFDIVLGTLVVIHTKPAFGFTENGTKLSKSKHKKCIKLGASVDVGGLVNCIMPTCQKLSMASKAVLSVVKWL